MEMSYGRDMLLSLFGVALFLIAAGWSGIQYVGYDVNVLFYLFHGSEPSAPASPYLLYTHYSLAVLLGWLQELFPGWDMLRAYMLVLVCTSLACMIFLALRAYRRLECKESRVLFALVALLPVAFVLLCFLFLLEYTVIAQISCVAGLLCIWSGRTCFGAAISRASVFVGSLLVLGG